MTLHHILGHVPFILLKPAFAWLIDFCAIYVSSVDWINKISSMVDCPMLVISRYFQDNVKDIHLDRKNGLGEPCYLYFYVP